MKELCLHSALEGAHGPQKETPSAGAHLAAQTKTRWAVTLPEVLELGLSEGAGNHL